MRKKYPIVEVEWLDAEEGGEVGWNNTKEMLKLAKKPLPLMQSLGYLVHDGEDHVALSLPSIPIVAPPWRRYPRV